MAYTRGKIYLWRDEARLHIWVADGYDGWDESVWHSVDDGEKYPVNPDHMSDGTNTASGVSIPQENMDEYVIMRLAQMIDEGLVDAATDRAKTKWYGEALQQYAEKIKASLKSINDI